VRRISMLLSGLFIGVVILSALIVVMGREYIAGEEQIITAFSHDISVPYHISSTPLILRNIVCYEGVFIEDGSQEEVSGIFGAVIENTGAHYVQTGEIWVLSDNELLIFKFSLLPPGSCTLVLEKNRKQYFDLDIRGCSAKFDAVVHKQLDCVRCSFFDMNSLEIFNQSSERIEQLSVYYKAYNPESGMYIGGVTYCISVPNIEPGEHISISGRYLTKGYSSVIYVSDEVLEDTIHQIAPT